MTGKSDVETALETVTRAINSGTEMPEGELGAFPKAVRQPNIVGPVQIYSDQFAEALDKLISEKKDDS